MTSRVHDTPFIGRTQELASLLGLLARVERGEPGLALLAGEAGVGKSRLLREVACRIADRDVLVLTGGCLPFGADVLPYAPFVEALREHLADDGGDTELMPPSTQAYQFERMLAVLRRLAAEAPVLLVLEDLHWADRTTLQLLVFLVRNLRQGRIGVVASWRDDEVGRDHPLRQAVAELARNDATVRIDLAPFDATLTARLLAGIHGAPVAQDVSRSIHERAQGNPFLAEELFAAAPHDDGDALPSTLRDVLLARVSGVDASAREVLALVAVLGGRADHAPLVAARLGADPQALPGILHDVVDRGLLLADGDGYRFRHELVARALLDDLLPFERTRLHAVAADAYVDVPVPRWDWRRPAEIAAHRLAAHQLDAALAALVAAGAAAADVGAFAEARRQLETALDLWDRVAEPERVAGMDRGALLMRAAGYAFNAGDPGHGLALAETARTVLAAAGDPVALGLAHLCAGYMRWAAGHGSEALAAYGEAVRLVPADTATAARADVLGAYAAKLLRTGLYGRARTLADEAIAIALRAPEARAEEGRARVTWGMALVEHGDVDAGLEEIVAGRGIAAELGRSDDELLAYDALGDAYDRAGRMTEALTAFAAGARLAEEHGLARVHGANLMARQAQCLMELGRWDEATGALDAASQLLPTGSVALPVALASMVRALDTGDLDLADRQVRTAEDIIARGVVDVRAKSALALGRATLDLWRGQLEQAAEDVDDGLAYLDGTDDQRYRMQLCVLGLSIEAERAALARLTGDERTAAGARARGAAFMDQLRAVIPAGLRTGRAELISGEAQLDRIEGDDDPDRWMTVADEWARFDRRWAEACACWRAAEAAVAAGRDDLARDALTRARSAVLELPPAAPLVMAIDGLAQRARLGPLPVAPPGDVRTPDAPPAFDLGLTAREREVLALLGRGRTNSEIGEALVISPKTASVHVTNIMRKLGVGRRVEAAAVAHRVGLANATPAPAH